MLWWCGCENESWRLIASIRHKTELGLDLMSSLKTVIFYLLIYFCLFVDLFVCWFILVIFMEPPPPPPHTPTCKYRQTRTLCGTIQMRTSELGHTTRTSSAILYKNTRQTKIHLIGSLIESHKWGPRLYYFERIRETRTSSVAGVSSFRWCVSILKSSFAGICQCTPTHSFSPTTPN